MYKCKYKEKRMKMKKADHRWAMGNEIDDIIETGVSKERERKNMMEEIF